MRRSDEMPPGFALHHVEDGLFGVQRDLIVPAWLKDELVTKRTAERPYNKAPAAAGTPTALAPMATAQRKRKIRAVEIDIEEEMEEFDHSPDESVLPGKCPVYERGEPLQMLRAGKESTPDKDRVAQLQTLYLKLKGMGRHRHVTPSPTWRDGFVRIDNSHPHFAAVTQVVRERLILAEQTGMPAQIPPLLLLGQAGIGKTHFARTLAAAIGTSFRQLSFDSGVTDAALVGSEKRWANTSYGALFEEICVGEHANPVILLDEIDKSLRDKRSDPLAPLHSLLEPVSARTIRDISLDFSFDASNVIWIATANYPLRIPQPLRTRFKEFWLEFPKAEDSIKIAREVARTVVEQLAPASFEAPGEDIGLLLGHLTAREVYHAVSDAVARAVGDGRRRLERTDFPADVLCDEDMAANLLH